MGRYWAIALQTASDELGGGDCEAIGGGLLAQPVNALTSLGFVVAGLVLAVRGLRARDRQKSAEVGYGVILIAIGLGSVAFHGPQPAGSQWMHDVPITAAFLFIFLYDLVRLGVLSRMWASFFVILVPTGIASAIWQPAGAVLGGLFAAGALVGEVLVYRRRMKGGTNRRYLVLLGLLVIAGLGYWFGRTGSVVCDPDSLLQLHGLWHLLAAAAFAVWGFITFPGSRKET